MSHPTIAEDPIAERSLIGTLLSGGYEDTVVSLLPVLRQEHFCHPSHRAIWAAITTIVQSGDEINIPTVRHHLEVNGKESLCGGYQGLVDLQMNCHEVAKPEKLVEILVTKYRKREAYRIGQHLSKLADDPSESVGDLLAKAGNAICKLAQSDQNDPGPIECYKFSDDVLANLADGMEGKKTRGVQIFGFPRVNSMTHGLQPGQLIILAARPGIGKTALAMNMALGVAEKGKSVLFFSLEMSKEELYLRLLSNASGVDIKAMLSHRDIEKFSRVAEAKTHLDKLPISISDKATITAQEISSRVDGYLAKGVPLGLVVVDYLQLISSSTENKNKPEPVRVADLSRSFKLLAKDRKIPVMVLSQLNREVEHRQGGKPQLSDLRDSGAIEQDADIVLFIHREMKPGNNSEEAELIFAKHRNGALGVIPMQFKPETTKYIEIERTTDQLPMLQKAKPRL